MGPAPRQRQRAREATEALPLAQEAQECPVALAPTAVVEPGLCLAVRPARLTADPTAIATRMGSAQSSALARSLRACSAFSSSKAVQAVDMP